MTTSNASVPPPRLKPWPSGRAHVLVLIAATLAGAYACSLMLRPFVPAFAWALAFGVLFSPLHRWTATHVKRSNAAASLSVFLVAVIVVVPATLIAARLLAEAARGASSLDAAIDSGEWQRTLDSYPRIAPFADWLGRQLNLSGIAQTAASWLTNTSASLVRGSINEAVGFLLMFYFLFYYFRDRQLAFVSLQGLSPLSNDELALVISRVEDTIHATFYGTVVCSAVQGTLGGLMFWWLALPAPLLWGVIMGALAVVPVFGAFVVWIPAAAYLALDGQWGSAAILVLWGSVVIGGIDNLLYPMLVGNRLRLHTVPAFVAVVGGLVVFGTSGVVLGPLVVTVTLALLEIWQLRTNSRAGVHAMP
jgi:predicted PurR-regulated permease PerM